MNELVSILSRIRKRLKRKPEPTDWQPGISRNGKLQMSRRNDDGCWVYREPTEKEAWDYQNDHAW